MTTAKSRSERLKKRIAELEERERKQYTAEETRSAVNSTMNTVAAQCSSIEKMTSENLPHARKSLFLDIKLLRKQRRDLQEALAQNYAKVARINRTLLNIGLRLEHEKHVIEESEDVLSIEE